MTAAAPLPRLLPLPPPPPPARFRLRAPRRTVRLRLTLLYVGLFLASAAGLLVITYFLVAQQLPPTLTLRTSGGGAAGTSGTSATSGTGGQLITGTGGQPVTGGASASPPARRRKPPCRPPRR